MTFVPYKGTGPAMTDLIGGQVDLMCEQATNAHAADRGQEGQGLRRHQRAAPDGAGAQRRADAGGSGLPDFNVRSGTALYAAAGTPPAVLAKLNAALRAALKDPELIKRQEALGITVVTDERLAPAEHKKFFESEVSRWTQGDQGRWRRARVS